MIIPNGKNKKYVEVVSGLYILYVILNPILNLDKSIMVSEIKKSIIEVSSDNSLISRDEIARTYILGLENNLKTKIDELGYKVDYIQFYITPDYNEITKIDIKMKNETSYNKDAITDLVLENFDVGKSNINII